MEKLIREKIIPHIGIFFEKVYQEKQDTMIDGTKAFNDKAQFVEGKIINAFTYYYLNHVFSSSLEKEEAKEKLKDIIEMVSSAEFKTWSILGGITGLYRLKTAGILDEVVSAQTLEIYKKKFDWRTFIREDWSLIDLPTNYYGVAFGVARYRELFGFSEENYSQKFFDILMDHVMKYSGEFQFMDETEGDGRFDRYSVLISGEIAALLHNTGLEVPEMIREMLRKSCDICLNLANVDGNGISYGRSIGTYGDTAVLEVLSIAAELGVLTVEEKNLAAGFSKKIIEKFVDFWIDSDKQYINMWDEGRNTDGYRNKNRILGENVSLPMQIIGSYHHFANAGCSEAPSDTVYEKALEELPKASLYWFSKVTGERTLTVIRDGEHVFMLPFVNGGKPYFNTNPYMSLPMEDRFWEYQADATHECLLPMVRIGNESFLPIGSFQNIFMEERPGATVVGYEMDGICRLEGKQPSFFEGLSYKCTYAFHPGKLIFTSELIANEDLQIDGIFSEFASFSQDCSEEAKPEGYDVVESFAITGGDYETPHGRLKSRVRAFTEDVSIKKGESVKFVWSVRY